ncbi:SRPBCC domain-containing protein [Kibdelosporangium philippinense]|uniref:SRPBCC domain-containing protein n=1 Tax=Kibdelosporangium philippinense TaxID=211113 RepID=A0ABS8ZGH9_9PSEU|nr:SRPBCC domain-containing protein [Kibdelosporangium philippinense]MCE7006647.1 SRPBCC domain-containing protein [Kibdelosporangium philippinense]
MSDILALEAHLPKPPAEVYEALTSEAALRVWLASEAEVSLPDKQYTFWGRYTPQGSQAAQQLLAVSDSSLSFAWTLDELETIVTYTLTPSTSGTVLRLEQTNLPTLDELMNPPGRRDGRHSMHTFWGLSLANLASYLEGRTQTPKADFSEDRSAEIRVSFTIDAPASEVFASLIDPAAIAKWFGWEAEVEPHVGGTMSVGVDGKIFEFEPSRKLVYGDDEDTVVRWELEGSAGKTHLTFVQSGYTDDELDSAAQHEAGWLGGIAELKRMHELGEGWTPLTTELPAQPS